MKLIWSPEATDDFTRIVNYIRERNPSSAHRIAHTIFDSATSLQSFPNRGRPGRVKETRELVLSPLPYILIYRANRKTVEIARILHGAQRWP